MNTYKNRFRMMVIAGILTMTGGISSAVNASDYGYQKDILIPSTYEGGVTVELDEDILYEVNKRFGNINLYNGLNEDVDFSVYFQNSELLQNLTVLDVSSQKQGNMETLVDGLANDFLWDERADGPDASWALIDLGQEVPLNRVVVEALSRNIKNIEVLGGKTQDDLKVIISKRGFQSQIDVAPTDPVRYVQINLYGIGVKVQNIRLGSARHGFLMFDAVAGENYKVLYGNDDVDRITYQERQSEFAPKGRSGRLTAEQWNIALAEDIDGDRIANEVDNCPFHKNKSQSDDDNDGVGNKCDNAPQSMNRNQLDQDYDGVGDVLDNCRLTENEDQLDSDNDGKGNACDALVGDDEYVFGGDAVAERNKNKKSFPTRVAVIVILGLVFIAGVSLARKPEKMKEILKPNAKAKKKK